LPAVRLRRFVFVLDRYRVALPEQHVRGGGGDVVQPPDEHASADVQIVLHQAGSRYSAEAISETIFL
jgi:hypothetical protein